MRATHLIALGAVAAVSLTGCSLSSTTSTNDPTSTGTGSATAPTNKTVTLVTHDSWVAPKSLLAKFTAQTGYVVKVSSSGDAGQVANQLVLTKGSPVGDVTFGIDNTFATRVTDAGVLDDYSPALPDGASAYALKGAAAKQLTPIDFSDVCVNVDNAWFNKHKLQPPTSLDDLTKPAYKNLFVTPGAATSSPGMAFLLSTISKYGTSGWQGYWKKLMANGTKVTSGWSDAWNVDYTAGGGKGDRPIILSYNSDPTTTVKGDKSSTSALLNTCFQSVEYAGVIKGAKNPAGAKAFVRFMLGSAFQKALPPNMYVFPVDKRVPLPADWKTFAKIPAKPWSVPPAEISKNRATWLQQWQDVTAG
ncbi:thiamine ABC transporter substrate-binding protein [Leekyejoonella antrihumi]|uniref:Thiamine ABC transporter substrate-binding protein n=1 Tax=Leekyejoonella antrihumi TaxID=1660198 RepID=A0A563EA46_9MICO|nr:thiamine ABC transporter substrate-binding protein [Leekyejoonella antrihumi]TWP39061.1 thiamine ABC transporter substrate-binding protein [Leekyejoonella antrihumi]